MPIQNRLSRFDALTSKALAVALLTFLPPAARAQEESWQCDSTQRHERFQKGQDIPYQTGPDGQKLDIHVPVNAAKPYKTIMLIHGGCFTMGSKSDGDAMEQIDLLVKQGYAVVSVEYRKADPAKKLNHYPAALDDVRDASCWIKKHGGQYGLGTENFAVAGYSAGGTLATYLATGHKAGTNHKVECGTDPAPAAAIVLHPRANFLKSTEDKKPGDWDCGEKFVGMKRDEQNPQKGFKDADILTHLKPEKTAPIFVVHGDADKAVNHKQSEMLCGALPGRCFLTTIAGADHMFRGIMDKAYNGICRSIAENTSPQKSIAQKIMIAPVSVPATR